MTGSRAAACRSLDSCAVLPVIDLPNLRMLLMDTMGGNKSRPKIRATFAGS